MKTTSLPAVTAFVVCVLLYAASPAQTPLQNPGQPATSSLLDAPPIKVVIRPTPILEPGPCPDWTSGTAYKQGDCALFGNTNFTCVQAHTAQPGWEPPNAFALWLEVPSDLGFWQPQTQYSQGDLVIFQGMEFQARQSHVSQTNWEPLQVQALWIQISRPFAPYIDLSDPFRRDLVSQALQQGVQLLTFASITAQNSCAAGWFGSPVSANDAFSVLISQVRTSQADVILSFGGGSGTDLALACPDAASLQTQYKNAIATYNANNPKAKMVDFNLAASVLADPVASERINIAVAALQASDPLLIVSYTLPVVSTGLTDDGKRFLANAKSHGVQLKIVNLMTSNFESAATTNPLFENVISAAGHAIVNVQQAGLSAQIGITPTIGQNDSAGQTFTQDDAQNLVQAAQNSVFVGRLSMSSINRDHQCSPASTAECSGVPQNPFDFSKIFTIFQ